MEVSLPWCGSTPTGVGHPGHGYGSCSRGRGLSDTATGSGAKPAATVGAELPPVTLQRDDTLAKRACGDRHCSHRMTPQGDLLLDGSKPGAGKASLVDVRRRVRCSFDIGLEGSRAGTRSPGSHQNVAQCADVIGMLYRCSRRNLLQHGMLSGLPLIRR